MKIQKGESILEEKLISSVKCSRRVRKDEDQERHIRFDN